MKKYLLFSLTLFVGVTACNAQKRENEKKLQCTTIYDSTLKRTIYTWADKMPRYKNGIEDVMIYFSTNFRYPENQEQFQGSVNIEFIVTVKGELERIKIVNKSSQELTAADREAIKVFSAMPPWVPGSCKGKVVPVKMIIPIKF